jgi:4-amino-4-deoxy-L-arabinose transferase-like glycosyltransferase
MLGQLVQRYLRVLAAVLGAACAFAVAYSLLHVAADYMGHKVVPAAHWKYLAIAASAAVIVGGVNATSRPWFEWLAYGVMLVSVWIFVSFAVGFLGDLRAGFIQSNTITNLSVDPPDRNVLIACTLVTATSVPVHVYLRRQIRRRAQARQCNAAPSDRASV